MEELKKRRKFTKGPSPVPELSFLPAPKRPEPGQAKREDRKTCMCMLRSRPFFPQIGEKTHLEVFSRFGLRRDFLNKNIQAKISAFRLVKKCQLIPNQWNFTGATLNNIGFVFFFWFFYYSIKDNEKRKKSLRKFVDK